MRDVKTNNGLFIFADLSYCLNYAGCKVGKVIICGALVYSIALTMRDVKQAKPRCLTPSHGCIALTMRDVKGEREEVFTGE